MIECQYCKREKPLDQYYFKHDRRSPICKACVKHIVKSNQPETFMWLLKLLDAPYDDFAWKEFALKYDYVFGRYLSWTKLKAFDNFGFEDSWMFYKNRLDQYVNQAQNNLKRVGINYEIPIN